ncbi:MAG TPA: hypothetical protein VGC97_15955 [Pyrinomonadaceae bacterium]|jgi:hypothetical protein
MNNDELNPFGEIFKKQADNLQKRQEKFKEVVESQHYKQEQKFLYTFLTDAIETIRTISFYSTRARQIYDEQLTIRASDDLIQSSIGILFLVENGIHNIAKREIRYLLEMIVKYLLVDQECSGNLADRITYLNDNVPNSSIEVVDRLNLPFDEATNNQFRNDIRDVFYKACAFTHPSRQQIEEQVKNYTKGVYIGFETAKMLDNVNNTVFRAYDLILTMLFIGFGHSMSGDLFIEIYDHNPKWKFHKGKYVKLYSKLFDYKVERQQKSDQS